MFKFALALMGSAAVLATPVAASAAHISSPSSSLVLQGPASLGSSLCSLTLNVTLTENGGHTSPPLYDSGIITSGTNTPAPSVTCLGITVTGGDVSISNYGVSGPGTADITINTLNINGTPCLSAPLTGATVSNLGTAQVQVTVPTSITSCGPIAAALTSISPTPVQVVP